MPSGMRGSCSVPREGGPLSLPLVRQGLPENILWEVQLGEGGLGSPAHSEPENAAAHALRLSLDRWLHLLEGVGLGAGSDWGRGQGWGRGQDWGGVSSSKPLT